MDDNSNEFIYKLRNGKIFSPTQSKFNLQSWENYKSEFEFNNSENQMIIECGSFIFKQLEKVRKHVSIIENEIKNLSRSQFIHAVVALSNFMRSTINMTSFDSDLDILNINELTHSKLKSDIYQNNPTLMDIAVGCIVTYPQKIMP